MATIDLKTGKLISGVPEVFQALSIRLGTRKGTRIMRRTFGGEMPNFVDRGMSPNNLIDWYAGIAATVRGEKRFRLVRCKLSTDSVITDGRGLFDLSGLIYLRGHLGDFSEAVTASGTVVVSEAAIR